MAKISDIVNVVITRETRVPTVAGFGRGAIIAEFLATKTVNPLLGGDRYQLYSSLEEMVDDGWTTSDHVYHAAADYFAQSPNPGSLMVGRKDVAETWVEALTDINEAFSDWYGFTIVATAVATIKEVAAWTETLTSPKLFGYDTADEDIIDGPQEATSGYMTTGVIGNLVDFQAVADGEFRFTVDGVAVDVTGLDFSAITKKDEIADVLNADAGFAAVAVATYDSVAQRITMTSLTTGATSTVTVLSAVPAGVGTDISGATYLNGLTGTGVAVAGQDASTDIATYLKALSYDRTILNYHDAAQDAAGIAVADVNWQWMAMMGEAFPYDPGSQTWAFKELTGISPVELSSGQENNALSKNVNVYQTIAEENVVLDGKVIGGEYIDIIRGTDWLISELQVAVFTQLLNNRKIPYTDGGIALVENAVRGVLGDAANVGLLDPTDTEVTVPRVSETSTTDRANRILRDVEFSGRYQGAIHKVYIEGKISV